MDKFIFTFKCLVLFFGFVGYFKYYGYLAKKCLNEFNYSLDKPGIVIARLTLTLISFRIILLGSTLKENLVWIMLPLIALFIKDLKNTNLSYKTFIYEYYWCSYFTYYFYV